MTIGMDYYEVPETDAPPQPHWYGYVIIGLCLVLLAAGGWIGFRTVIAAHHDQVPSDTFAPEVTTTLIAANHMQTTLKNVQPPFTTSASNPTMEKFPHFTILKPDGTTITYYPPGTVWYQAELRQDNASTTVSGAYTALRKALRQASAETYVAGLKLTSPIGAQQLANSTGGFIVADGLVQYVSYHTVVRAGSRFIPNYDSSGFEPLNPHYVDTWIFIGEPIPMKMLEKRAVTQSRDASQDILVSPPYHAPEPPFTVTISDNLTPEFSGMRFSINDFGIRGSLPGPVQAAIGSKPTLLITDPDITLLSATIPTVTFPNTAYRGTTLGLYALTDQATITRYCLRDSEPAVAATRTLGERQFAVRPHTLPDYESLLFTSYDQADGMCFVIEATTQYVNQETDSDPNKEALHAIIFAFVDALHFED